MQKVMVKVSHCTCSSRSSKHPLCSSYTSILLRTGISSELPVTRLHTSRPHRTCTRPQLGQLDHFKGMIDTKGGGLSLPLGSRPRTATRPGPFLLLHRGHLGPNTEEREKRKETKLRLQLWIQPHRKLAPSAIPSSEHQAIPILLQYVRVYKQMNYNQYSQLKSFHQRIIFPQTTLYPFHQTEKSFRCNRNSADCY